MFNLSPHLIGRSLRGLAELHVLLEQHESPELLQHGLDCVLSAPPGEDGNMSHVNLDDTVRQDYPVNSEGPHHSVAGHAVHVDSAHEFDSRRLLRIVVPTFYRKHTF